MSPSERAVIETGRRRRRRHSPAFKAEAVGACQQAGVSIAAVALARGLNANMLRDWMRKAERSGRPIAIRGTEPSVAMSGTDEVMAVRLPRKSHSEHDPHRSAPQGTKCQHRVAR